MTEPAHSIGKLGFRRWYERRLIESHAWLVTAVLSAVLVAASFELTGGGKNLVQWIGAAGVGFVAALIVWHGVRRFLGILAEAEHFAEQSTCARCGRYGAFRVTAESPQMAVCCRKCGHEWKFD